MLKYVEALVCESLLHASVGVDHLERGQFTSRQQYGRYDAREQRKT